MCVIATSLCIYLRLSEQNRTEQNRRTHRNMSSHVCVCGCCAPLAECGYSTAERERVRERGKQWKQRQAMYKWAASIAPVSVCAAQCV